MIIFYSSFLLIVPKSASKSSNKSVPNHYLVPSQLTNKPLNSSPVKSDNLTAATASSEDIKAQPESLAQSHGNSL